MRAGTRGDLEYLRILHLAASTMDADVAIALSLLLGAGRAITTEVVKALISSSTIEVLAPAPPPVVLAEYDHASSARAAALLRSAGGDVSARNPA